MDVAVVFDVSPPCDAAAAAQEIDSRWSALSRLLAVLEQAGDGRERRGPAPSMLLRTAFYSSSADAGFDAAQLKAATDALRRQDGELAEALAVAAAAQPLRPAAVTSAREAIPRVLHVMASRQVTGVDRASPADRLLLSAEAALARMIESGAADSWGGAFDADAPLVRESPRKRRRSSMSPRATRPARPRTLIIVGDVPAAPAAGKAGAANSKVAARARADLAARLSALRDAPGGQGARFLWVHPRGGGPGPAPDGADPVGAFLRRSGGFSVSVRTLLETSLQPPPAALLRSLAGGAAALPWRPVPVLAEVNGPEIAVRDDAPPSLLPICAAAVAPLGKDDRSVLEAIVLRSFIPGELVNPIDVVSGAGFLLRAGGALDVVAAAGAAPTTAGATGKGKRRRRSLSGGGGGGGGLGDLRAGDLIAELHRSGRALLVAASRNFDGASTSSLSGGFIAALSSDVALLRFISEGFYVELDALCAAATTARDGFRPFDGLRIARALAAPPAADALPPKAPPPHPQECRRGKEALAALAAKRDRLASSSPSSSPAANDAAPPAAPPVAAEAAAPAEPAAPRASGAEGVVAAARRGLEAAIGAEDLEAVVRCATERLRSLLLSSGGGPKLARRVLRRLCTPLKALKRARRRGKGGASGTEDFLRVAFELCARLELRAQLGAAAGPPLEDCEWLLDCAALHLNRRAMDREARGAAAQGASRDALQIFLRGAVRAPFASRDPDAVQRLFAYMEMPLAPPKAADAKAAVAPSLEGADPPPPPPVPPQNAPPPPPQEAQEPPRAKAEGGGLLAKRQRRALSRFGAALADPSRMRCVQAPRSHAALRRSPRLQKKRGRSPERAVPAAPAALAASPPRPRGAVARPPTPPRSPRSTRGAGRAIFLPATPMSARPEAEARTPAASSMGPPVPPLLSPAAESPARRAAALPPAPVVNESPQRPERRGKVSRSQRRALVASRGAENKGSWG